VNGRYIALGIAVLAAIFALHQLLLWMERRGWIYYWHKSGSGNAGNVLMPIQAIYEPTVRYTLEEKRKQLAEEDEAGDKLDD